MPVPYRTRRHLGMIWCWMDTLQPIGRGVADLGGGRSLLDLEGGRQEHFGGFVPTFSARVAVGLCCLSFPLPHHHPHLVVPMLLKVTKELKVIAPTVVCASVWDRLELLGQ